MRAHFRQRVVACVGTALLIAAVIVPSAAADVASTWTSGPSGAGDNTYAGFIDAPTANATVSGSFAVTGWFVDKTAQGWTGADDIEIYQGTMDGGGKSVAKATLGQDRPDVATALGNPFWEAAGFTAVIPPSAVDPGQQTLSVYAHTPGKGWWYEQVQVNVTSGAAPAAGSGAPASAPAPVVSGAALPIVGIESPKDGETVPTKSDYQIIGYALDQNASPNQGVAGSGIDRVQVYIGKDRDNGGTFLGEADLGFSDSPAQKYGGQFASAGWRLAFKPTAFKANSYILFAYARSALSGKEDTALRYFVIHE